MNLRRSFILALVVTGSWSASAAMGDNPYTPIVTRNIFGLVPIPVHNPADDVPVNPPPKITPNGIMTLFGKLQVLFKVAGVAAAGQPPKDESYVLGEGERQDDIEVQKIDEKSATITFNNHGTIQELALVASKASTGAPAPATPGLAPGMIPRPGAVPTVGGANAAVGFGGRFGRSRPAPGASTPGGGAPGFGGGATPAANTENVEHLSPEAQVLMIEANRMETQEAVNQGFMQPMPPTVITPEDATGVGGSPLIVSPDPVQPKNKN